MQFSTQEIVSYLAIITLMITFARLAGAMFRRHGMPAVIGELIAGIALGPTVMAHLAPDFYQQIFKSSAEAKLAFDALLTLSSIILLFVVGLEIKLSQMIKERKAISWLGLLGVLVPFAVGAMLGKHFVYMAPEGVSEVGFITVIAAAFAVSALPVIARILLDLNLLKTRIGSIIIGGAAVNDIVGWLLFIVALGIAGGGEGHQIVPVWAAIAGALISTILAFTWLPKILNIIISVFAKLFDSHLAAQGAVVLPMLFGLSLCAEYLGLHALFGAFILGIALSESHQFEGELRESIEVLNAAFFAPIYFVAVGLKADFLAGFDFMLITTILVFAFLSKMVASRIGGYFAGLTKSESTAVGLGLAARGGMGIIVASIAYASHVVDLKMFEALVVMAVVTSFTAALIPKFLKSSKSP
jgi:Kef-type K+ transport system membrane component KefB